MTWLPSSSQTWRQSQWPNTSDVPSLVLNTRKNTSSGWLVAGVDCSSIFFELTLGEWQSERVVYTDTRSHAHFFSVEALRRTCYALRTLQHFYASRSDWRSHSTMSSFADLPCVSATVTTFHFHEMTPLHLRDKSRWCLAVRRQTKKKKTHQP